MLSRRRRPFAVLSGVHVLVVALAFAGSSAAQEPTPKPRPQGAARAAKPGLGKSGAPNAITAAPKTQGATKGGSQQGSGALRGKWAIPQIRFPDDVIRCCLHFYPLDLRVTEGDNFEIGVVLSNGTGRPVDGFRLTIVYDLQRLQFRGYDRSPLDGIVEDPKKNFRYGRRGGELMFGARFAARLSEQQKHVLTLRFTALDRSGAASIRFLTPPTGTTAVYSVEGGTQDNILGNVEQGMGGVLGANVFVQPRGVSEEEAAALADADPAAGDSGPTDPRWLRAPSELLMGTPVSLELQAPEKTTLAPGQDFWVDLVLRNDGLAPLDTIGVQVQFDPAALEVIDEDEGNRIRLGTNIWDGAFHDLYPFDLYKVNAVDNKRGEVRYVAGRHYDAWAFPTGVFGRIHFRARAAADLTSLRLTRKVSKSRGVEGTFLRALGADRLAEVWDPASPPRISLRIVSAPNDAIVTE